MALNNITIGADPELFITKNNSVVSAVDLIPGTKKKPWKAEDMPEGFALQTDNVLAEFNIPPVDNMDKFVCSIEYMKDYIRKYVKTIDPAYDIKCSASEILPVEELQSKQALRFGCDVDYNTYTESANPKPQGATTNLRSAGFHIHVGYTYPNIETSLTLIKYLDMYLGIPSVVIDPDSKRRSLYGKAGCFRLTSYGFEYRTLSSVMMKDVKTLQFVWEQLMLAINAYEEEWYLMNSTEVQDIINNSDVNAAKQAIEKYSLCADYLEL